MTSPPGASRRDTVSSPTRYGDVVVIRYEGTRDGPCLREMQDLVSRRKELSGYLERYAALVSGGAYGAILN